MAGTIETRATLGGAFIKGLSAKLYDIQNQADQAYSLGLDSALGVENNNFTRLFREETSDQARETIASKTGVGFGTVTPEGADYAADSRIAGYETQFNFQKITNSVTITEEDDEDRLVDAKLSEFRDLLVSAKMTMDRDAFNVFNNAFTAQASLPSIQTYYGDAVPMASTLHPIKDTGGTQSNASSTSIPLTEQNLETARTALRNQLDDKALPMNIGSGRLILVVPDTLEKTAVIITNSKLRNNTANNDMNIYDGIVTVVSTKWINALNSGSDTAWFLVDSTKSPLIFFKRRGIRTSVDRIPENENILTKYSMRYQVGNDNFRGLWASQGDGSAYSA